MALSVHIIYGICMSFIFFLLDEEFLVANYESSTPYGWRLAAVSDVLDSLGNAKYGAKEAISNWDYGIACLANNARVHF